MDGIREQKGSEVRWQAKVTAAQRPPLPAFRDSRCLVSKDLTPLDRGWIVDARRLPDQVSTFLQQRGGIRCSGTYRMDYLH
jgi:hypothetical protein